MRKLIISVSLVLVLLAGACSSSGDSVIRSLVLDEKDFPSMISELTRKTGVQFADGSSRDRLDDFLGLIIYSCLYNIDETLSIDLNASGISFRNADLGIAKTIAGARISSIRSYGSSAEDRLTLSYHVASTGSGSSLYLSLLELARKELGNPVYTAGIDTGVLISDGNGPYDPLSSSASFELYLFSVSDSIFFYIDPLYASAGYISLNFCTLEALYDTAYWKDYDPEQEETAV